MAILAPLAALLGIEIDSFADRLKRSAITYALIALFALICATFLLVAVHAGISLWIGPVWAALAIAGLFALAAVIIWFSAQAAEKARQRRIVEKRKSTDTTAILTTAAITAIPLLISNPMVRVAAVPIGALIGYMLLSRRDASTKD